MADIPSYKNSFHGKVHMFHSETAASIAKEHEDWLLVQIAYGAVSRLLVAQYHSVNYSDIIYIQSKSFPYVINDTTIIHTFFLCDRGY